MRKIAENYKLPYYTMSPTYSVCKNHGYLTGEQFTCPYCGESTEVYSRITGYYRPVQNWNDGKAQEYKDRRVYDISRSTLTHVGPNPAPIDDVIREATQERACCEPAQPLMKSEEPEAVIAEAEAIVAAAAVDETQPILFKTPTCPNCKAAMALLDKAGVSYQVLNADEEKDLVAQYGIKQAPTLVVPAADGFEKFRGVSNIKGWIMQL